MRTYMVHVLHVRIRDSYNRNNKGVQLGAMGVVLNIWYGHGQTGPIGRDALGRDGLCVPNGIQF